MHLYINTSASWRVPLQDTHRLVCFARDVTRPDLASAICLAFQPVVLTFFDVFSSVTSCTIIKLHNLIAQSSFYSVSEFSEKALRVAHFSDFQMRAV